MISKQQALESLKTNDLAVQLEAVIDEKIKKWDGGLMNIRPNDRCTRAILETVQAKYRAEGWKFDIYSGTTSSDCDYFYINMS